jgi:hypothetical protein
MPLIAIFVAALGVSGCNFYFDLDSVPLQNAPADVESDAAADGSGSKSDADSTADADGSADADAAVDTRNPAEQCNVLNDEGCESGETCVPTHVAGETRCVPDEEFGTHSEGEPCATYTDCDADLVCVNWALPDPRGSVCSEPCSLISGEGCITGEFCAAAGDGFPEGLGFCTARCDILQPSASCPDGQLCVPDPFYPGSGFPPHFRCLQNGGASQKSFSSECTAAQLDADGCPDGLTCLPIKLRGVSTERCLESCRDSLDECTLLGTYVKCAGIDGSPNVGYCSL